MTHDGAPPTPRVSVITIFLNAEMFLAEAVESVLAQSYQDFELILVDDGSSDTSVQLSRDYARKHPLRIRYLDHVSHANRGMSASRNAGIAVAKGEYIAFIDADDAWKPEKLAEEVSLLDAHPQVALLAGAINYWRSWNGGNDRIVPTGHVQNRVAMPPEALLNLYPLGRAGAPAPSAIMVRKTAIEAVGGFEASYTGPLQMYEDQAFLTKIYLAYPVYFASRSWVHYRQHDGSCMSENIRNGRYHDVRKHYLEWYADYLKQRGSDDQRVWRKLAQAHWPYDHPVLYGLWQAGYLSIRCLYRWWKRTCRSLFRSPMINDLAETERPRSGLGRNAD